jgi:hypothetical protein
MGLPRQSAESIVRSGVNLTAIVLFALSTTTSYGQVIVADNFNVAGSGSGFALNAGINSSINPPATRLTGTAAANLRYMPTSTKVSTAFGISANKLLVTPAANPGRFTLSPDGVTPFNFAAALGAGTATPTNPVLYDLAIRMANNSAGIQRFSFALGVAEGDATTWNFGVQVYRTASTDNFYTIGKRIDIGSSGLATDLNAFITNTTPGTYGTELSLLMRVTDAGAETTTFNSRVQLSLDGGFTWFYDTATDAALSSGWRLNGSGRYILWDVAPDAGNVTYDSFSVSPVPIAAQLISPPNNTSNLGGAATLKAAVSNTAPGDLTVTYFGRQPPQPGPGADFLIAVLPDTQNYAREASGSGAATKEMWFAQTEWIITNRVAQNIAYVATLGDCVQNADDLTEWRNATNAMYRLELPSRTLLADGVPYGVTVGNHDQDPAGDLDGPTIYYNQYFGTAHFSGKSYYGGHFSSNNDSWFDLFSAGGMDFLVFSFEYGRYGTTIMDWANDVLATNQNRRVIVLTHHAGDDTPDDSTVSPHSAQGGAIYDALKTNPNFFLMLGGHVFNEGGEGRRSDTYNGRTVRTLISDYQGRFNGGNGLMRLMYFSPSNNLVSVKTYSPYTGNYETDANSQFSFPYNMQPNGAGAPGTPWLALGTNTAVSPGSLSSFVWPGLQANKTYEWYVTVTDAAGNRVISAPSRFATTANSAPIASNLTVTVVGDQPGQLILGGFDANGDALTFRTNSLPIRGFISNFDATNGTLTYQPAHGYRGLDQFLYQVNDSVADSSVAMFNLNVTAPPDTNANGLPDSWEAQYGITDPQADSDGDGQSDLAEYVANTSPTNAASVLQILGTQLQPIGELTFNWSSVGGTRYRVQYSDGSTNGGMVNSFTDIFRTISVEMDSSPYGIPSTQSFTDTLTSALTNRSRYYRVRVAP